MYLDLCLEIQNSMSALCRDISLKGIYSSYVPILSSYELYLFPPHAVTQPRTHAHARAEKIAHICLFGVMFYHLTGYCKLIHSRGSPGG